MAVSKKFSPRPHVRKDTTGLVRVIRDSANLTRDYWIREDEAKRLYADGSLAYDLTNHCYMENKT